ncbi:MAG: PQQ-binding-like beta-propeller repeat protein [Planctomycetales bacterium]
MTSRKIFGSGAQLLCAALWLAGWGMLLSGQALGDEQSSENWPAWRKDGSGVSQERNLPQVWNATKNVLWKTPIAGKGNSSPVVWDDFVLLTTCAPGTSQHYALYGSQAVILVLGLVALAWIVGGRLRDPLEEWQPYDNTTGFVLRLARRALLAGLVVILALLILPLVRFNVPKALPIGFVCVIAILPISTVLGGRRAAPSGGTSDGAAGAREPSRVAVLTAFYVLGMAGAFIAVIYCYLVADYAYSAGRTWFSGAIIGAIGLVAGVGALPRHSTFRVVASLLGLAMLPIWAVTIPAAALPLPVGISNYYDAYLVVAGVCGASLVWFGVESWRLRRADRSQARDGLVRYIGPVALCLLAAQFFVTINFLLPSSVSMRQLVCLDRRTGTTLWQTTCFSGDESEGVHVTNTLATPTPVTDGRRIYVHFGGGGAFCLDFEGHILWKRDDPASPSHWGAGSSPVLWKDRLLLTYDLDRRALTVALDTATGEVAWQVDRTALSKPAESGETDLLDCYSTPLLVEHHGQTQFVTHCNGCLIGYDPATGNELWQFENQSTQIVTSPVTWNDVIIIGAGIEDFVRAVRLSEEGGKTVADLVWEEKRQHSDVACPVVSGDYVYFVRQDGVATCLQAATGKTVWKKRLPGRYDSSVVAGDEKIYACNTDGLTSVLSAEKDFNVLSENPLDEPVQASFALSHGNIFIRGRQHLYCIGSDD